MSYSLPNLFPQWFSATQLPECSTTVRDWLFDDGSLTLRLKTLSQGAFSVVPLNEGIHRLRDEECAALQLPQGSHGWVREVFLCGHAQPWVFARSVAALEPLQASGFALASLGQRSLGDLLFNDPQIKRSELLACHYPQQWLPQSVCQAGLWARRSCFYKADLGILVMEAFLPALWENAQPQQI